MCQQPIKERFLLFLNVFLLFGKGEEERKTIKKKKEFASTEINGMLDLLFQNMIPWHFRKQKKWEFMSPYPTGIGHKEF